MREAELPSGLTFFAGAPVFSSREHCIGVVCIVHDGEDHAELSAGDAEYMRKWAKKCSRLLDFAREKLASDI